LNNVSDLSQRWNFGEVSALPLVRCDGAVFREAAVLNVKIDRAVVNVMAEKKVLEAVVTKMICPVPPSGARSRAKRALASHQ
jgi:uncharacterized protein (TIGR02118 family)